MAPATDVLSNISTVNPDTVPSPQSPCHLLSGLDLSPTQTVHQMSPELVKVKFCKLNPGPARTCRSEVEMLVELLTTN